MIPIINAPNGPTIQDAKAAAQESLWHFLEQLPGTMEAQLFYGLMLAGIIGMIANYTVKWAKGEIAECLVTYLFRHNVRGTILSFITYISAAITAINTGIFTVGDANIFVGWANVLINGFTIGFAIDATVNKGTRPIWTESERKEKT